MHIRCRIGKARLERDNRSRNVLAVAICCDRCAYNLHIGRQIDGIGGSGGCRHGYVCRRYGEGVSSVSCIRQRDTAVIHPKSACIYQMADGKRHGCPCNSLVNIARDKTADTIGNRDGAVNLGVLFRYLRGASLVAEILAAHGALPIRDVRVRSIVVYARVSNHRNLNIRCVEFIRSVRVREILTVAAALPALLLDAHFCTGCRPYRQVRINKRK